MKRRSVLFLAIVLVVCMTAPLWSEGQKEGIKYPERSIKAMVGFGAGGPTDVIGRGILPILQEKIGVGIGITNMPGAAGATAAAYTLQQPADGYTLYMGSEIMSIWQTMGTMDLSYKDFVCIKLVCQAVPVLAVPPDSKFKSAREFLDYAVAHPGEIRIGTAGPGTVPHISGLMLTKVLDAKFTFVPFQGGGPAVVAVMGGQVDATIEMVQGMVEHYRGGKLKILASFTNKPLEGLDFPAIGQIEPKLAPYLPYGPYFGLFAPKGTPDAVVKILKAKMDEAMKDPRWSEYCKKLFLPQIDYAGEAAVKFLGEWTSKSAWLLYEMGGAKSSPANFGIPKP